MSEKTQCKSANILDSTFFRRDGVVNIAKELIGKVLCTQIDGQKTSGIIVETEAYDGVHDKACHAHAGRFTKRTKVMYKMGGIAYIYLCYGIHHLFNIITNDAGIPDAVLIRAIEPQDGIETMLERRKMVRLKRNLTAGPGVLSQALGLTRALNATKLSKENGVWVEDQGVEINPDSIQASARIGIGYAGEDALLPYRFYLRDNDWVSPAKA